MKLKNIICENCKKSNLELKALIEPKEIVLICCNCGLTQTLFEFSTDSTFTDLEEKTT